MPRLPFKIANLEKLFEAYFLGDKQQALKIKRAFILNANHLSNLASKKEGKEKMRLLRKIAEFKDYASKIQVKGRYGLKKGGAI